MRNRKVVPFDRVVDPARQSEISIVQSRKHLLDLAKEEGWEIKEFQDEVHIIVPMDLGLRDRTKIVNSLQNKK